MSCAKLEERKKVRTVRLAQLDGSSDTSSAALNATVDIPSSALNVSVHIAYQPQDAVAYSFSLQQINITPVANNEQGEEQAMADVFSTPELGLPFSYELIGGTLADKLRVAMTVVSESLGANAAGTFQLTAKWEIRPEIDVSSERAREILSQCNVNAGKENVLVFQVES